MANFYGSNSTKAFVNSPADKVDASAWHGRVRWSYDEYDFAAILGVADKLYIGNLPKGAKVLEATLAFPDLGTTGVLQLGYEYKVAADGTSDPNAFLDAVDANAAADTISMSDQVNMVGFGIEMAGDAYVVLSATTATTATSGKVKVAVMYIVD